MGPGCKCWFQVQAAEILEASMRALEDLRSRFAASQRTVGHLSRQLIAAQLHQQASPESAFCTAVTLEAQEAQLSRHQTCAPAFPPMHISIYRLSTVSYNLDADTIRTSSALAKKNSWHTNTESKNVLAAYEDQQKPDGG